MNGPDLARIAQLRTQRSVGLTWAMTAPTLPATASAPSGWRLLEEGQDGRRWMTVNRTMSVIESVGREDDGRRWHHVSMARKDRDPSWAEMRDVKRAFIGDREAYIVLPPEARYVNIHQHCLHLWACLDVDEGAILPDFTSGARSL